MASNFFFWGGGDPHPGPFQWKAKKNAFLKKKAKKKRERSIHKKGSSREKRVAPVGGAEGAEPRGRDTKDGPTPFFYSFFFIEKNSVRSKGNTAKKKIDTDDLDFIFSPFFFLFFYWWTVESGALFFLLLFDFFFKLGIEFPLRKDGTPSTVEKKKSNFRCCPEKKTSTS